jgi:hypothetical protein
MDVLWLLKRRLRFVRRFYDRAVSPFEVIKRAIERHEEPYPIIDAEDGEPEYQTEWQEADESINVLGFSCLAMVQSSLEAFLYGAVSQGSAHLSQLEKWEEHFNHIKEKGWLRKFQLLFRDLLDADWGKSGAQLDIIHQAILTRDDFIHGAALYTNAVYQRKPHSRLFPLPFFGSDVDLGVALASFEEDGEYTFDNIRLEVSGEKLDAAIREVATLAEYVASIQDGRLNL